ncbi:hypothetical protein ACOMICROBIO_LMKGKHOH_02222 [Vibrio sp. B1FIG11]|nr:hypothetical protein ACOMICROBIO_LMKGKHOH_02222 [Vibrio sp. B1FIG11]CAE6903369.1 hypothetical protein ACOMICROBIO_LMKGKHOH_02222 [Vibrio sp. B1FIG11]
MKDYTQKAARVLRNLYAVELDHWCQKVYSLGNLTIQQQNYAFKRMRFCRAMIRKLNPIAYNL